MKINNLNVNEKIVDKQIKLKRELGKIRNTTIINGIIELSLIGMTTYMFPNASYSTPLVMLSIFLSFDGAYELSRNFSEYKNLAEEYKKLVKKND